MLRFLFFLFASALLWLQPKPKTQIFLVGDSTVAGGHGTKPDETRGWGDFLQDHLDTVNTLVINKARGGRSSRTYIAEGLWDEVHEQIQPGDYVIIQFGHNDAGPINDDFRARGSMPGNNDDLEIIDNILTKKREVVFSYGWYIRKYIADTKAKGGIPIVCSLIARNRWTDGKVDRATDTYNLWSKQAAEQEGAYFIDLNDLTATAMEKAGIDHCSNVLFTPDKTHTNINGAQFNAAIVAKAIKRLNGCELKKCVK